MNTRRKLLTFLLGLLIFSFPLSSRGLDNPDLFQKAEEFYSAGQYREARTLFEQCGDDALSRGYVVLCALKSSSADAQTLMVEYERAYPSSVMSSRIRLENALRLFDLEEYALSALELSKVDSRIIPEAQMSEYVFKCGYCQYMLQSDDEALNFFTLLDALDHSTYSAPGLYLSALIYYNRRDFPLAEQYFKRTVSDPRFQELSEFYIVDCEFNQKNYEFASREGERLYANAPKERRERLSRIISESALVLGDAARAREYYESSSKQDMNRKDYFYAASVLYNVKDYKGAIENYSRMGDRSDSLGQVANYNMANSYLSLRNQVSAMDSFRQASEADFDPGITEDALFNYAKLSFDLNKDTRGFSEYIRRYSSRTQGEKIYGYMALAALYDRDYKAAVDAYDQIDELSDDMLNNYTKANFLLAQQLFDGGSYRDAIPYFKATAYYLPKSDRLNQLSRFQIAEASYRVGDYDNAAKIFIDLYNNSALDGTSEALVLPYNAAWSLFKQGKWSDAARWFDLYISKGIALYREDALCRRADCDFALKNYKDAASSYQKVMSEFFSADNIYPYYQLSMCYGLLKDKKKKVATLSYVKNASPQSPMYAQAFYELGKTQMEMGSNQQAIETFRSLYSSSSDPLVQARALIGQGMVLRNLSRYEQALDCYKKVVQTLPNTTESEEAMLAIESIYHKMGRPDKFLEYVEQNSLNLSRTDEQKEQMYFTTAEQLYLSEEYSRAITSLQKFLQDYPASRSALQARFYLAESYRLSGEKEKACAEYAICMKGSSEESFTELSMLHYAELSFALQRYQDAYSGYSALYQKGRMESNRPEALKGMMYSAYRSKDYQNAVESASELISRRDSDSALQREATFIKAKSCLALSKREEAMKLFSQLGSRPDDAFGAESKYILIQSLYDSGNFDSVASQVYDFSQKAGDQSYWLARAYLVLGDSFLESGHKEQAKATYESIRDGYVPSSGSDDIPDSVLKRLEKLSSSSK